MKRDYFTRPLRTNAADTKRTRTIWKGMRARCADPKDISYHRCGALGVSVCERWRDFTAFVADMGHAPPGLTLERRDSTGGYRPQNCTWATPKQQARGKQTPRRKA